MADDRRESEALRYHAEGRPGKLEVSPTKPTRTQRDLSLAYTPGVAEPSEAIAGDPEESYRYTARGNLVAVVSDGSAVLGLGDVGPEAAKPVMEGKAVLFKCFADIDVFDLEVEVDGPGDLVRFCEMLEPTVGGINLEDIAAPACFEVERALRERLDVPVFHDDQHGTAIISGAALINALEVAGKEIGDVRIVFSGAGSAGLATAEHYVRLGADPERILMADRHGVVHAGRDDLDRYREPWARETEHRTLADALVDADVLVGLSVGGVVDREMVASMAERPIVFAMANPEPEIRPEEVREARVDALVATGRSDYPNQVNNVLGFPFIFRGALDVRARAIDDRMMMAATRALAELAREDVPDAVAAAYGGERMSYGPEYLIPKPFDSRVLLKVAPAVAEAAMESGAARETLDLDAYLVELEARLGPARELMRRIMDRARRTPKRIVFPEGDHERVVRATAVVRDEGFGEPVLLGDRERVEEVARATDVDLEGVAVVDPERSPRREAYARELWRKRRRKGVTRAEADRLLDDPTYFASMMLERGDADTLIAGADMYYPDALRPALQVIGTGPEGRRVAGLYIMVFEDRLFFFADATVNIEPDEEELAEIALASADFVERLGLPPRIAMLSFSDFGSARHERARRVRRATERVKRARPGLAVDGEMQADTAVVERILTETYPFADLDGPANILVFPELSAANVSYKLLTKLGGAEAIGPLLLGTEEPVHILQRGATVAEIANLAALAVVDAETRPRQTELDL